MAHNALIVALGIVVGAAPVSAAQPETGPESSSPVESADGKYCLHVESVTGSRIETVQCWTREEWAEQDVDLDQEWPREGVVLTR